MNYGYVGLGNLGGHLAASLIRAGHSVTVYDRDPALAGRLRTMSSPACRRPPSPKRCWRRCCPR